MKKKHFD